MPKKGVLAKDQTRNFIVNEGQLRMLLRHCPNCQSFCGNATVIGRGVDVDFHLDCAKCGIVTWASQPKLPDCDLNKGNLDLTAAVVLGGNTYSDIDSIASNLNLEIMSEETFCK